jgi:hypothetical protein
MIPNSNHNIWLKGWVVDFGKKALPSEIPATGGVNLALSPTYT